MEERKKRGRPRRSPGERFSAETPEIVENKPKKIKLEKAEERTDKGYFAPGNIWAVGQRRPPGRPKDPPKEMYELISKFCTLEDLKDELLNLGRIVMEDLPARPNIIQVRALLPLFEGCRNFLNDGNAIAAAKIIEKYSNGAP